MKKIFQIALIVFLVIFVIALWWRYYFVFGEGVKAGNLNLFVKKGFVFKTYEGRLIQDGFKSASPGALQSNEFEFSVTSDSIASILERNSGKNVELKYKEYLHSLPWRGKSNYVVIEVLNATNQVRDNSHPYQ
jgi:hypothetical protein